MKTIEPLLRRTSTTITGQGRKMIFACQPLNLMEIMMNILKSAPHFMFAVLAVLALSSGRASASASGAFLSEMLTLSEARLGSQAMKTDDGAFATKPDMAVGVQEIVAYDVEVNSPVKVAFEAKVVRKIEARDSHWGIRLHSPENGDGLMCYNRGLTSWVLRQSRGGKSLEENLVPRGIRLNEPVFGEWFHVEITVEAGLVSVFANEQTALTARVDGLPFTSISFYSYNFEIQIRNATVGKRDKEEFVLSHAPIFTLDHPATNSYALDNPLSSRAGGVMVWTRLKKTEKPNGVFFELRRTNLCENGLSSQVTENMASPQKKPVPTKTLLKLSASYFTGKKIQFHATAARKNDPKPIEYHRSTLVQSGDWTLTALTWDEDNYARFFVNQLPVGTDFTPGDRNPDFLDTDLDGIDEIFIPFPNETGYEVEEIQIFRRTLTNEDVWNEYRKRMPVDMVAENTFVDSDKETEIAFQVGPAGFYTKPMPFTFVEKPSDVGIRARLYNFATGEIVAEKDFGIVNIKARTELKLNGLTLDAGEYSLACAFTIPGSDLPPYQRTTTFRAFTMPNQAKLPVKDDLVLGALFFEKMLDDPEDAELLASGGINQRELEGVKYIEGGKNKGDCITFEVSFPEAAFTKPVVMELEWPDNAQRSMGVYLYPFGIGANRDRNGNGIHAGNEYPNSGDFMRTRFIVFPAVTNYLFEIRTMAPGYPAAARSLRFYRIEGDELPHLAIHSPDGLPRRYFGFTDEDQTFDFNLNLDSFNSTRGTASAALVDKYMFTAPWKFHEISRYFHYVGFNILQSPLWRYNCDIFPKEGMRGMGLYPAFDIGDVPFAMREFKKHGLKFMVTINWVGPNEIAQIDRLQNDRQDDFIPRNKLGDYVRSWSCPKGRPNLANPRILNLVERNMDDGLRQILDTGAVAAIDFNTGFFPTWADLDMGYDDFTVKQFEKETGIPVPETEPMKRFEYLTGEKRAEWLKWRAEKVTAAIRLIRSIIDRYDPSCALLLTIPDNMLSGYEQHGLDVTELALIQGVKFTFLRQVTKHTHDLHWGNPESDVNDRQFDFNLAQSNLLSVGAASADAIKADHGYFETFVHPIHPKYTKFCYFQNQDIKAKGRYFLKEFTFDVGAYDAMLITSGGQPLTSLGAEALTREFAQAYLALPAVPFTIVDGIIDPVVARYANTKNGTYIYFANLSLADVEVKIENLIKRSLLDLSTGMEEALDMIALRPYELRSFLFHGGTFMPTGLSLVSVDGVEASPTAIGSDTASPLSILDARIVQIRDAYAVLENNGVATEAEKTVINAIVAAREDLRLAELHRLSHSVGINAMVAKTRHIEHIIERDKMAKSGAWRVNCGVFDFYRAKDGKLYLPDQNFKSDYGSYGKASKTVARDFDKPLAGAVDEELFRNEAYDMDGYKFVVPVGKSFKVKLAMRYAYAPGFKETTNLAFDIVVNGEIAVADYDLYAEQNRDILTVANIEIGPFVAKDGLLDVAFRYTEKRGMSNNTSSVRTLNTIEIIPLE